jgi:pyruvate kinase
MLLKCQPKIFSFSWIFILLSFFLKTHMSEMFAYHATMMANTLGTSIVVFTRTGFMAMLLSHYRPSGTIFAFTNK